MAGSFSSIQGLPAYSLNSDDTSLPIEVSSLGFFDETHLQRTLKISGSGKKI